MTMDDEANYVVLNFHDSLLYKADVCLLDDQRWLNDKLLGFCFEQVSIAYFVWQLFQVTQTVAACGRSFKRDTIYE